MATELYFALPSALRLAEHALTAPVHLPSLTEHDDSITCAWALEWVADDGTYLMSNGTPALLADPHDPTSNIVVHAEDFGPGSDRHWLGLSDVGFDDFTEHLHLTDGDPPLIDRLCCVERWHDRGSLEPSQACPGTGHSVAVSSGEKFLCIFKAAREAGRTRSPGNRRASVCDPARRPRRRVTTSGHHEPSVHHSGATLGLGSARGYDAGAAGGQGPCRSLRASSTMPSARVRRGICQSLVQSSYSLVKPTIGPSASDPDPQVTVG
jgi:hypothetical protein